MEKIIKGPTAKYLQEAIITQRDERFVVPVKAEYKGQVNGIVHDTSATGATIFVEPMSVVTLNNELKELEAKEQTEIEKILADLSNLLAEHIEEIHTDLMVLSQLDFIFARAALSKALKCSEPDFNTDGIINLK